jgi:hypothetical protein
MTAKNKTKVVKREKKEGLCTDVTVVKSRYIKSEIVKQAIDLIAKNALEGDISSCKYLVDKEVANAQPRKGTLIKLDIKNGDLKTFEDVNAASESIFKQLITGKITLEEAHAAGEILKQRMFFLENVSYDKQLAEMAEKERLMTQQLRELTEKHKNLLSYIESMPQNAKIQPLSEVRKVLKI